MRFYRANLVNKQYVKAAPVKAITWSMKSIVLQNKQGDAVAYQGKFTSTEAIRSGAFVISDDGNGVMKPYRVEQRGGMAGINVYLLREEGMIRGANG